MWVLAKEDRLGPIFDGFWRVVVLKNDYLPVIQKFKIVIEDLSASTLDNFSNVLEGILRSWNFPDAFRVYFDRESRDFVISYPHHGRYGFFPA